MWEPPPTVPAVRALQNHLPVVEQRTTVDGLYTLQYAHACSGSDSGAPSLPSSSS
jgi:hypothetical protein